MPLAQPPNQEKSKNPGAHVRILGRGFPPRHDCEITPQLLPNQAQRHVPSKPTSWLRTHQILPGNENKRTRKSPLVSRCRLEGRPRRDHQDTARSAGTAVVDQFKAENVTKLLAVPILAPACRYGPPNKLSSAVADAGARVRIRPFTRNEPD